MTAKKDARRNNGSEPSGDTEAKYPLRVSAELMEAMRKRAARDGQALSVAMRRALEFYLEKTK